MLFSEFVHKFKIRYSPIDFRKLPNINKKREIIRKLIYKNSTPIFIADEEILLDRLTQLKAALQKNWGNYKIAYSIKTNYEIAKSSLFKKEGLLAEVVSGREYQFAKSLGYKGSKIIFNGPYKKDEELTRALKDGALINIDNFDELERVLKISKKKLKLRQEVGIRINTEIPFIATSRFGFSIDNGEAKQAVKKIIEARNLSLVNFHIHIGTDIDEIISYQIAARKLCNFIKENVDNNRKNIKSLDFGGGFPGSGLAPFGRKSWYPKSIGTYVSVITEELKKMFINKKPSLILEPGRYLVDDAVIFITEIINVKYERHQQILTTNAAVTMLPLIYYRPQIVKLFDNNLNEKKSSYIKSIVYGASCKEDDILYTLKLPKAVIGDFLIFYVMGAYNQNMASDFIFDVPALFEIT